MQNKTFAQNIRSQLKQALFPIFKGTTNIANTSQDEINSANIKKKEDPTYIFPSQRTLQIDCNVAQQVSSFDHLYSVQQKIGEGAHAVVKKCTKINSTAIYAVKIFRTGDPEIIGTIKQTFNNNRLLHECPLIIQSYDLFIDERKKVSHWVMEYCEYQPLEKLIGTLKQNQIKQIIYKTAEAICFMHSKGISHRDLKPDNILVSSNIMSSSFDCEIKIIDFGVSKLFLQKNKQQTRIIDMWTRTGTILYSAPEIFEGGGYNEKVDIWSLGVILFQLLLGRLPFQDDTNIDTIEAICNEQDTFDDIFEFTQLDHIAQDLLKRLLKKNPAKRLSAKEVLLHPWIQNGITQNSFSEQDIQKSQDEVIIEDNQFEQINFAQSTFINLKKTNSHWVAKQSGEDFSELQSDAIKEWKEKNRLGNHIHYLNSLEEIGDWKKKQQNLEEYKPIRQGRKSNAKIIVDEQTHQRSSSFSLISK